MNNRKTTLITLFTLAMSLAVPAGMAADSVNFRSASKAPAKVTIEGTSNLHDWTASGSSIDGGVSISLVRDADGAIDLHATFVDGTPKAEARIPIDSLDGSKRGMNGRMEKALKADKHDTIEFVLREVKLADGPDAPDGELRGIAIGDLSMAGSTKTAEFDVTVSATDRNIRVDGAASLDMTDFGVEPPRAMFGALRTGEIVTVTFTWHLEPGQERIAAR